jgi:(aminoalkyl)phosphonate N-acetyltransferase
MEQTIKIRNAGIADVDTIFSFICHLEETSFEFKSFKERFSENLENENCIYLCAVNNHDECIGFISCQGQTLLHHEGLVFEIQEMYVAKNFRDKGIGKLLFAALEEKLKEIGCGSFEVTTNVKRSDARRFYTKLGFVQTHVKFVKGL